MARSNASVAAAAAVASAPHHIVFVATSLDTGLAVGVSDSDTVSDLKKKIIQAHSICFSMLGEIKISAVKVKRRGHSYHLFDSMPVISAFNGMRKGWFLSVDASSPVECLPLVANADAQNGIVEIGGSHDVHETDSASEKGVKALQDLVAEGEGGGTLNPGGGIIMPADKYPKLRNEDGPSENILRKKRRKIKRQEADTPNSDDATLHPERAKEVDNVYEPEKAIVIRSFQGKSSEAHDRIEKAGVSLVQKTVEEKMQSPLEENGSLPLVTKMKYIEQIVQNVEINETNTCSLRKRKKNHKPKPYAGEELQISNSEKLEASVGNGSMVEPQQPVNFDQSGCTPSHKMNSSEAEGKATEKVDAGKESCNKHGVERELCPEIMENANDVKEKTNDTTEKRTSNEKCAHQTSSRPEEEQNNQLEVVRDKIAVMDGNKKSSKEHRDGPRSPRENIGDAENSVKERKKRTKKSSSKEKSVDQTSDRHRRLQGISSKGHRKAVGCLTSEQHPDNDPMDEMMPLEHITKKVAFEDNTSEKKRTKKTRKDSSKDRKDDRSRNIVGQEDRFMSQFKGRDTQVVHAVAKELGNVREQILPIAEKLADSGNFEDKTKKTSKEGAKEIDSNKDIDVDRIDKQEGNFTQAGVIETMVTVADKSNTFEHHGNEKDTNLSSYQNDKEACFSLAEGRDAVVTVAAEFKPYELNGNGMDQLQGVTEQSPNANIGKKKTKKKSMRQSGPSKDRDGTNQSYVSQKKEVLTAICGNSEVEGGNEGLSSLETMGSPTKPDNDVLKTLEKNMKQDPKIKGIDQSSDMTGKEKEICCQSADGEESVAVITDKSFKWDRADTNGKKAEKRTKSEQSYKKSIQSDRDIENNTMEEGTSGLDILAKIANTYDQDFNAPSPVKIATGPATGGSYSLVPVQSSEAINQSIPLREVSDNLLPVGHSDDVNNSFDRVHPRENINFKDNFVPQQEVAAPGNSLVDEGPKETRVDSELKVRHGKRKATSSTSTGSGQLNVQTGVVISQSNNNDGLVSPVKKLSKTPGNGRRDSTFPEAKTMDCYDKSEKDCENSAAAISGLLRLRKSKRVLEEARNITRPNQALKRGRV
ncbi:hypothetical protein SAY87_013105 [Trapa incisa]|uniref:Uncharacterized protein n=1 Tax=Trapa incisa TaxID=236973 RepID=A0AAN7QCP0_9MYRT|nr:hypothetical protein SAY87_013105 [Trapa incisa]